VCWRRGSVSRPVGGDLLDHRGYCVTVTAGEASKLGLGVNADEELDAQLGAVDAEMALAIALLLFGRGQSHNHPLDTVLLMTDR
jgi:hypothetical protein